jgi:hypothetical protein
MLPKQATGYVRSRKKLKKRRFGAKQSVDNATYNRTLNRLSALDSLPKGVNENDKITGSEARKVKRALRRQKNSRTRYSVPRARS